MQLSGIDVIYYYSTMVFRSAGLADPQMATTCLGVLNVFFTLVSICVMDKANRRTLLLASWSGMCFAAVTLTATLTAAPVRAL